MLDLVPFSTLCMQNYTCWFAGKYGIKWHGFAGQCKVSDQHRQNPCILLSGGKVFRLVPPEGKVA